MNHLFFHSKIADTDWECFGQFDTVSIFCKKRCALRLGCIVMREKIARLELIKELEFDEPLPIKIQ